jgi:hypothetical protein
MTKERDPNFSEKKENMLLSRSKMNPADAW